jgi:hypothetical protein
MKVCKNFSSPWVWMNLICLLAWISDFDKCAATTSVRNVTESVCEVVCCTAQCGNLAVVYAQKVTYCWTVQMCAQTKQPREDNWRFSNGDAIKAVHRVGTLVQSMGIWVSFAAPE